MCCWLTALCCLVLPLSAAAKFISGEMEDAVLTLSDEPHSLNYFSISFGPCGRLASQPATHVAGARKERRSCVAAVVISVIYRN